MLVSQIMRNKVLLDSCHDSVSIRRVLIALLYDKVSRLSIQSLAETNSGKLINMVSSDIQTVERGLNCYPFVFSAPCINILAFYFVFREVGLGYTCLVICIWLVIIIIQSKTAGWGNSQKTNESKYNDERLEIANNIVVGSKTIKCFGWEPHYEK